jgi:fructokinase
MPRSDRDAARSMSGMILVAGEALIDLIVHPDGRLAAVPGGGPFNTARTIARLEGPAAFLGRLSTDRFGAMLRDALAGDGVDLRWATSTEAPTTLAVAELDATGTATYRFHLAETSAPGLELDDVDTALRSGPDAVHVGTLGLVAEPIATSLSEGLRRLGAGTLLMVDPNCRPRIIGDRGAYLARLHRILARADIVKVSGDDLAYLDPDTETTDAARALLVLGPAVILLTDGSRSVRVVARSFAFDIAVPTVKVVDTVGSGDAFGGGFLARWIERGFGRDELADAGLVRDAVEVAIEVAGLTCGRAGADPPRRDEVARLAG